LLDMTKTRSAKRHCEEILCAGFGGQGIMFMGKLLALAGLLADKYVTWMPSYGAEVRGGTAYSMVKISDGEIASPIVINPDVLIVMNKPSLVKYEGQLKEGGILISNKTLVGDVHKRKGITTVNIPLTEAAAKLGDIRSANMIAIGALAKRSRVLSIRNITAALAVAFKNNEELLLRNKKALEKGYKW
ncbi:MAG: 2-oxoacid:acceptor oxidoreductase family protein, partial [Candidatus Omnitrophica bacterium]|nr:2-oxoacid:acceptor oxidoreductase family protein [Candidatus Omnitrophota bacterium]